MSRDVIGDFLTVIRNGLMVSKPTVQVPFSKLKLEIAQIFKNEGFIKDCAVVDVENGKRSIKIFLKYVNGESAIHEISRVSTPGCRTYSNATTIKPVIGGLGISVLSTNRGIMSNRLAKKLNVGGEVICTIW